MKKKSTTRQSKALNASASAKFPIIGIGASAGGFEAFASFLKAMPTDSGMAFVFIQHLDPKHESNLKNLFSRYTSLPVHEVAKETRMEPNNVYIIPSGRNMSINHRKLYLTKQLDHPGLTHNIDIFFRSLAEDLKEYAICIILSGTGNDGVNGAKAVKANLGMVIAQDPATAKFAGMPQAIVSAGVADYILSPDKMAKHLVAFVQRNYTKQSPKILKFSNDTRSLEKVLEVVRAKTGYNFFNYKSSTIHRRIQRRVSISQVGSLEEYQRLLDKKPEELNELVRDFLINVTAFFRDPEAFDSLEKKLLTFLKGRPDKYMIRVWVPGCSTGEEAYSIAIVLQECVEKSRKNVRFQIFATDMDSEAIVTARRGIYPPLIALDVNKVRLKKYFVKNEDGQYQIKRELREKLVFADQDFINDPPFSKIDIISVRNVLIYFNSDVQKKKVMPMLHYSLNNGGILFLGTAESVGELSDKFTVLDKKWKIFQRRESSTRFPVAESQIPTWQNPHPFKSGKARMALKKDSHTLEQKLLIALPPSLLIDNGYNVHYTHGAVHKFVRLPEGKPTMNLLDMVRPEMRTLMVHAINEAFAKNLPVFRKTAVIKSKGEAETIKISFRPTGSAEQQFLIISFENITYEEGDPKTAASKKVNKRVQDLEDELKSSKENLRSTIEELETANEELRSANEEFQSTNEELQSTNEELETSREELQSVNEELITVNTEHQRKIEELSVINDDMKNMLNCSGIATIFLDNNLCLLRFTPTAKDFFNLIDSDMGRPLSHITGELENIDLSKLVKNVLQTLIPVKQEVKTKKGLTIGMKIHPYRTTDNNIAGVVITFLDVNSYLKQKLGV